MRTGILTLGLLGALALASIAPLQAAESTEEAVELDPIEVIGFPDGFASQDAWLRSLRKNAPCLGCDGRIRNGPFQKLMSFLFGATPPDFRADPGAAALHDATHRDRFPDNLP